MNLTPEEDIAALLRGEAGLGRAEGVVRIAVPPFKVLGRPGQEWMGEAASELLAAGLAQVDGIAVVERGELTRLIEELRLRDQREQKEAQSGQAAASGKLLGARLMVLGTLVPRGGGGFTVIVKPVRVEDGVVVDSLRFDLSSDRWERDLQPAVDSLAAQVGFATAAPPMAPLSRDRLELAARARDLQYQGKLLEAQPLYERALARPSSAWGFEAEYLRLLLEMQLNERVVARADAVLARMPRGKEVLCDRARVATVRVQAQARLDAASVVREARQAVRTGASCGDPTAVSAALMVYGFAMEPVHYPTARAAMEAARAQLGPGPAHPWLRCYVSYQLYYDRSQHEQDDGGDRTARWLEVANLCDQGGNLRLASSATIAAAGAAFLPADRSKLYRRAAELATTVGGGQLDRALFAVADDLRAQGHPSDADERLLAILGGRIRSIVKLYGGMPAAEGRIDDELLTRCGVKRPASPPRALSGEAALEAATHRKALATALRAWARRTRLESVRQADHYDRIADEIDPPAGEEAGGGDGLTARLAAARLPVDAIDAAQAAPLRNAGGLPERAAGALVDECWRLRGAKAPVEEQRMVIARARKVAGWLEDPQTNLRIDLCDARVAGDAGERDRALALLARIESAPDSPAWQRARLEHLIEVVEPTDPAAAADEAQRLVEVTRRIDATSWIWASVRHAAVSARAGRISAQDALMTLVAAARRAQDEGAIEAAALALDRAASLFNELAQVDGSQEAVGAMQQRLAVVDTLGDPLRTLLARADLLNAHAKYVYHLYRGRKEKVLSTDPLALRLSAEIERDADALVQAGRARDAARVIDKIDPGVPRIDALLERALTWAETFKDSAEYPVLAAQIHVRRGLRTKTLTGMQREYGLARDLYLSADDLSDAVWVQGKVAGRAATEVELWPAAERCLELAGAVSGYVGSCLQETFGFYLLDRRRPLSDRARLKAILDKGTAILPDLDREWAPKQAYGLRVTLAGAAAHAGDLDRFDQLVAEIRRRFTETHPDPYQWASKAENVARATEVIDPKRSIALHRAFDEAHGASDYWKAMAYHHFARHAERAGDVDAARLFVERGRASAERSDPGYLYAYDLLSAWEAARKKDWKAALAAYDAAATIAARSAEERPIAIAIDLGRAVVKAMKKDAAGARAILAPLVEEARGSGDASAAPCLQTRVIEVAAALEAARGACVAADELRGAAAAMRDRCTSETITGRWTERTMRAIWTAPAGCRTRFTPDADLLP